MLTENDIQQLVARIVQRVAPEQVIVFGSYAKGVATGKSDLDLFVIKDTQLPRGERSQEIRSLLTTQLIRVDVHVYAPEEVEIYGKEEYSFVHSVLRTGKVYYSKAGSKFV